MIVIIIKGKTKDGKECYINVNGVEYKYTHCLKKFKWLNTEKFETYRELCKQGIDYNQISDILGVCNDTIAKLNRECGIRNRLDPETLNKTIKFLLENEILTDDIQRILGVSNRIVYKVAHEIGMKRWKNKDYDGDKRKTTKYLLKLKKVIDCIYQ